MPRSEAHARGAVSITARMCAYTSGRTSTGRLAVQCDADNLRRRRTPSGRGGGTGETRGAQNAMPARACGFDSRPRYHIPQFLTRESRPLYRDTSRGAVAQLGEHKAGSLGVRGSNPLSSTNLTEASPSRGSRYHLKTACRVFLSTRIPAKNTARAPYALQHRRYRPPRGARSGRRSSHPGWRRGCRLGPRAFSPRVADPRSSGARALGVPTRRAHSADHPRRLRPPRRGGRCAFAYPRAGLRGGRQHQRLSLYRAFP
jgi:hypothetical protein